MLFEKSSGNIEGVLVLMETLPLAKIESIFKFWTEITMSEEDREKRMREKADKAAQDASDLLLGVKMENKEDEARINNFLEIYKRKT